MSYSAITTYQQCPLRYYFRYVAGLPEQTVSASLAFGGAIHRAAELHLRELLAGNPAPDLDQLLAEFQTGWQTYQDKDVLFGKGDDFESLTQLAARMLAAFQQSDAARPHGHIIGIEEELRGPLVPGCPDMLARLDLIVDAGDSLVVTDLKTARSRWSEEQVDQSSEQLLLYSELARELAPHKAVRLRFVVITKAKNPAVQSYEVGADPGRLRRTKRVVERVWKSISEGNFYPAPSQLNCSSCPFRTPCRAWQG